MKEIIKTKKELRKFAAVMTTALSLIGLFVWWRERSAYPYLFGAASIFLLLGLLAPGLLRPVEQIWMKFAEILGAVMSRVVLTVAFILVITPFALVLKLFRRELLGMKIDHTSNSYWEPVEKDGPGTRPRKPY